VVAMFYLPALCLLALGRAWDLAGPARRRYVLEFGLAVFLGLALSAPYWFTVIQMRTHLTLEALDNAYYLAERHWVLPLQLISRQWAFGGSTPDAGGDAMSFQLGLVHLGLAVIGGWAGWRASGLFRAALLLYGGCILLMMPAAAPLWTLPLLKSAQFPWRLLSITASLQLTCLCGAQRLLPAGNSARTATLLAVAIAAILWCAPQFQAREFSEAGPALLDSQAMRREAAALCRHFETLAAVDEFRPRTARTITELGTRGARPLLEAADGVALRALPGHGTHRILYLVHTPAATVVTVNQLYLPGWSVQLDGEELGREALEAALLPDGRVRAPVPAGEHTFEARYAGPPGWQTRNLVIGMCLAAYAALWLACARAARA